MRKVEDDHFYILKMIRDKSSDTEMMVREVREGREEREVRVSQCEGSVWCGGRCKSVRVTV